MYIKRTLKVSIRHKERGKKTLWRLSPWHYSGGGGGGDSVREAQCEQLLWVVVAGVGGRSAPG